MQGVLIKLKELEENFTKNEKKIANYIIENNQNLKDFTTYSIAKNCQIGQATVVRFAKKLGFKGFPELKIALAGEFLNKVEKKHIQIISDEIKNNDSTDTLAYKVSYENIKSIEDSLKIISFEEIDRAVEALNNSNKIFILGAGSSSIVAKDFQYKLWELGKIAIFDTDHHIQLGNISMANKGDILFVISYSGKTQDIYEVTSEYKKKGVTIIALTQFLNNPIKKIADISLTTVAENKNIRSNSLTSRIAQLTIIDILYVKLIQKNRSLADAMINEAVERVKKLK